MGTSKRIKVGGVSSILPKKARCLHLVVEAAQSPDTQPSRDSVW